MQYERRVNNHETNRAKKKKNNANSKITSTAVTIATLGCTFSLKRTHFICINSVKMDYFKR